ncbi:MAG: ABC transporter ATP-binding protein [Rubripirellula sp.]|nr:ABC transporter ATP-binding protein [Rubripirellula sp.]
MAELRQSNEPLFQLLRRHRKAVAVFVVVTLLSLGIEGVGVGALISILNAWGDSGVGDRIPLIGEFLSRFDALSLIQRVRVVAIGLLVVVISQAALVYARNVLAIRLSATVDEELKAAVVKQVYDVSLRYMNEQASPHIASLFLTETTRSAKLVFLVAKMAAASAILVMYAAVMLVMSWQLTVIAVVLLCGFAYASRLLVPASKLHGAGRSLVESSKRLHAVTNESLSSVKLAHLYSQEKECIDRFSDATNKYLRDFFVGEENIVRAKPLLSIFAVTGLVTLLITATFFAGSDSNAWLASTSVFLLIVFRLLSPASDLNSSHAMFNNFSSSFVAVKNFLKRDDKPYLQNGLLESHPCKSAIQFENVSFSYSKDCEPVLRNLTFQIPCGKKTAIVGASGCGKSTIINLLARLYDPDEGVIRADEVDLRDLELNSWRRRIAIICQESLLFHSSVLKNLKFARPNASEQEVLAAAELAQVDDFVRQMPAGYETVIGDQGVRLSGGQRQRLAIARALVADPEILILDEATSALDSETEQRIQDAVDQYSRGRTCVISAHRLSTIRDADKIIVLSKGQIVEEGTHAELMGRESHYTQLVQMQGVEANVAL